MPKHKRKLSGGEASLQVLHTIRDTRKALRKFQLSSQHQIFSHHGQPISGNIIGLIEFTAKDYATAMALRERIELYLRAAFKRKGITDDTAQHLRSLNKQQLLDLLRNIDKATYRMRKRRSAI